MNIYIVNSYKDFVEDAEADIVNCKILTENRNNQWANIGGDTLFQ